ncbi:MAG: tetratricopeptide repeat protein [Methylophilaceae bacterium]
MKNLTQSDIQHIIQLHEQGDYKSAIKQAQSFIKHLPNEIFLWNILGACFEKTGDLINAQKSYEQALKINNQIPEIIFNLGAVKFNLNDSQGALDCYDRAIKVRPDFVEVFFNKGILFQQLGNFEEAIVNYQKAIQLQPGFYEALNNMGSVYQQQGRLDEAIDIYRQSLMITKASRTHFNLAGALRNLGQLKLAIQEYENAINLEQDNAEFFTDIGDALWHDGNINEGRKFLLKAIEVDPNHPKANYQLAIFYYDNQLFELAIPHFEKANLYDASSRALYCHYKLKQFNQFEQKLKKVIGTKHTSPLLATLSNHYAVNFNKPDLYNFCPNPLEFVLHERVPELEHNNHKLRFDLLSDIEQAEISDRKQSRLYNGIQSSGNLFQRNEKSFQLLSLALKKMIQKYYEMHQTSPCAFIKLFPKDIEFSSSWYVRMKQGGHLNSHIHEDGWISGAVYLSIPKLRESPDEGAIELSTDGDNYPKQHNNFPKLTILPNEGDVIFFPSSVFHRTIPFNSDEERICIAFDLKPSLKS